MPVYQHPGVTSYTTTLAPTVPFPAGCPCAVPEYVTVPSDVVEEPLAMHEVGAGLHEARA
jgi:hypothetical protein